MAINTIAVGIRNSMCDALVDAIDVGAGANGTLEIGTDAGGGAFGTLLATLDFAAKATNAFTAASAGVASDNGLADETAAVAGTAGVCRVKDCDGNILFLGTVGTSGADINFNTVAFSTNDTVSVTSMTITMPAS